MKTTGIVLIVIGLVMIVITSFNFTTQKKVVDLGPLEINKEENHPVKWSPIIGGILVVAGIVVVVTNNKK